ncbi:NADH dehydrogenase [ubiquinone] iron-sulfur protein 4, mitochondrial-like protein [Sarcoptes scabiei]|nr:NADH dehydrogenase [ubiquinone] iron-sulfur protein 4, mitochondrial-like protein [Sarcoptes scabiei]
MLLKQTFNFAFKTPSNYLKPLAIGSFRYKSQFYLDGEKEDNAVVLADHEKNNLLERLKTIKIDVKNPNVMTKVSGIPDEHVENRRVRIYKPAKNAMQSGTFDTKLWRLDFENRARWENPLMGWTSTGDPHSNLNITFATKEDAMAYCERNGFAYEVDETHERRKLKQSYADNFSWNKRTRVGSK